MTARNFWFLGVLFAFLPSMGQAAPTGFEDPALLASVMDGEIVTATLIDTKEESQIVAKAFFKNVKPQAYVQVATNYPEYPKLFDEVREGRLLTVNNDKTIFTYELDIHTKVGLIPVNETAAAKHTITYPANPSDETFILNQITNFTDIIEIGDQRTRLIPYQDGFLYEDTVHFKMKETSVASTLGKKKLAEFFGSYPEIMRTELNADVN